LIGSVGLARAQICETRFTITAREVVALIEAAGWLRDRQKGSHAVFTHPSKSGRVVVPMHSGDIPKGTLNDILKRAGLKK
jgi:predicted RNA binding protein YcfA (HicA-like mRNA interferase family)